MIYARSKDSKAPFDDVQFQNLGTTYCRDSRSAASMLEQVSEFNPSAIHLGGWSDRQYMSVCRRMRSKGTLVIAGSDTQWANSFRQHVAGFSASLHLRRAVDVMWVPGDRQRVFAAALGYTGDQCWDGSYACDWDLCSSSRGRNTQTGQVPYFLFVGRYVEEKGIDTLVDAFRIYKDTVSDPWRLVCVGKGPLAETIRPAGIEDRGFIQPEKLPDVMSSAGGFILPSRFEPWGVVIQEAAAAGLPLLCSDACGAAFHLLRDCYNGFTFPAGSAASLAERMARMSSLKDEELSVMGERSFQLSKQYTPRRWADVLLSGIKRSNAALRHG
jgi:glycosyltransferase involved in cell wall biosynthesis